jgi:small-conductance mechanosensitive channel/CRP-like cAMP-binding protein
MMPHALFEWNLSLFGLIAIALLLQLLITRLLPEGKQLLRMHLSLVALGWLMMVVARVVPPVRLGALNHVFEELVLIGWGVLLIRIVMVAIFRLLLPFLHMSRPRILEDIVFSLFCFVWALLRLPMVGFDLGSLLTTSAALTAILAIAMKDTLGNVLGGLALQLDNSLKIGDWITLNHLRGKVIEIHWRHTALLTNDGEIVVVPNSVLVSSSVLVFSSESHPYSRRSIHFSVNNGVSPGQVISAVESAICSALIDNVAPNPAPDCIILDYREGLTCYVARYWMINPRFDLISDSAVRKIIFTALRRHNLSLGKPNLWARLHGDEDEKTMAEREQEILERMEMLSLVKLFADFQPDELRQVAQSLYLASFSKGEIILRQGTLAHWLFLLVQGEAEVWYEASGGKRQWIATLDAGAVFGEMSMMTGEPCRATITARSNLSCYRIDKQAFEAILQERPALADALATIISERNPGLAAAQQGANDAGQHASHRATILQRIRSFFALPGQNGDAG